MALAMIWELTVYMLARAFVLTATLHLVPVEYSYRDSLASLVCSKILREMWPVRGMIPANTDTSIASCMSSVTLKWVPTFFGGLSMVWISSPN